MGFGGGNLRERVCQEDPGIDWRIILSWTFRKWDGGACTGLILLRIGTGGGSCKCSNEPSGSQNVGNFLTS
jgi:hypothetical protein